MTKRNDDVLGVYADTLAGWQTKLVGGKPTRDALAAVHALGLRPGKQALANAMAMRPDGVTGSEIVIACGAPQLNRMRGLIADGLVKREMVPHRGNHTVYKLTLTDKGKKRIAGNGKPATPAKVTKPKASKKPKAPKPVEPVTVTEPAQPEQTQA